MGHRWKVASLSPGEFELRSEILRDAELLSAEIASIQNSLRMPAAPIPL